MRLKFFVWSLVSLVAGLLIIYGGYEWFLEKQQRVLVGTARPEFPYGDYSLDELNKLYPQYPGENIPTTQTPEQTYEKFKSALKVGDASSAAAFFFGDNKKKYLELFRNAERNGSLLSYYKKLDEKIIPTQNCDESRCVYIMENQKVEINFIRNSRGVWMIEFL